jgi:hypothetical protein
MTFKRSAAVAVLAAVFAVSALPSHAQSAKDFEDLRAELMQLRAEIEALKNAQNSATERVEQVELQAKDAVVAGDIPNSFRLPGSDTSLRLYGFAELNMVHEFRGDNSDNDYASFLPYAPIRGVDANANRRGRNYIHARTSRIGLEASTPSQYGPIGVKIEGDFNNEPRTGNAAVYGTVGNIYTQQISNSYGFRLRHAYGQVGNFLVGQTWSTFMDVDNLPETVDFNGPIGATFLRQPQIRYTYPTAEAGSFTVALENSVSYVLDSTGTATPAGFSRVPDLIGRWDKSYDWGAVSVRGVTHEHRINDGAGVSASRRGYGIGASGLVKTTGDDFLTWAVTGGTGIGRYFNYIEGAFYDAGADRILMEKALGVVLGYQHVASERLRFNAALGVQKNFNNEYTTFARANGLGSGQFGVNSRVWQAHLGFIWTPVDGVDLGAEYIFGRRTTLANERGDMSRINLSAKYYFN